MRPIIDLIPGELVSFRGSAKDVKEEAVELVGTSEPFHITGTETNLQGMILYQLETIEEGKHYLLRLRNLQQEGNYNGFVLLHTDIPLKSEIRIYVQGKIVGSNKAPSR